jgi:hypothetical protein
MTTVKAVGSGVTCDVGTRAPVREHCQEHTMFGRKARRRSQQVAIESAAFVAIARATALVCAEHSDPERAANYFASVLLGTMAAYGVGPDDGPEEKAAWEHIWQGFGGAEVGDAWQVSAEFTVDDDDSAFLAELLAPLMRTPREQVSDAAVATLGVIFGEVDPAGLSNTQLVSCRIAGLAVRTFFEETSEAELSGRTDPLAVAASVAAAYLQIAAKTDALQTEYSRGRVFRVTMTSIRRSRDSDAGPGKLFISNEGFARYTSDGGVSWDLGEIRKSLSDYTFRPDGSLSAGFNPPLPLMMFAEAGEGKVLGERLAHLGLHPRVS